MNKQNLEETASNDNHEAPYDTNKSSKAEMEIDHRSAEFYHKKWFHDL